MSKFEIVMPKLGESIQEGTITKWFVKKGDKIEEDDILFEVATDKVDSEIPSPVDGFVDEILFETDSVVPVGEVVAILNTGSSGEDKAIVEEKKEPGEKQKESTAESEAESGQNDKNLTSKPGKEKSTRFYSPLVKTIAGKEDISYEELETIKGSGSGGRVQKKDILEYINKKKQPSEARVSPAPDKKVSPPVIAGKGDKVMEMDRIRKLIAQHMVMSKQVSPHVTSVVEADVTDIVIWRENNKDKFQSMYGEKITYMPFFIEAAAAALKKFPMVNSSVDGDKIILRKNINIGIAVAKTDGNLIVPVVKNAEQKNLAGLAVELNRLAEAARNNKLSPDEIEGGTFTITNFGTFRNLFGTPIINQPQTAILATGSIEKKPAVIETPAGDAIAIRNKMYLSLSYDHRVIDGALGGAFLKEIADNLEKFDSGRSV
jgi:2-oxoglutarate dehydrogenase E2 component (dihydrolipoamide succinyltransferase)